MSGDCSARGPRISWRIPLESNEENSMRAITLTVSLILFAATPASAHFVFIIPDAAGQKATVVFSDKLERDSAVDIGLISGTKLSVRQRDAKEQPVAWTKGEHAYTFDIPGTGARQIAGTTEYGVMPRGGGKPFLLVYHPKAIVGDFSKSESLGDAVPVEILPVRGSGGIRFRVLAQGNEVFSAIRLVSSNALDQVKQTDIRLAAAPVPEPATWAMMILGFGLIGAATRRKRTGLATA